MFSAAVNGAENGQDAPVGRTCGWPDLASLAMGKPPPIKAGLDLNHRGCSQMRQSRSQDHGMDKRGRTKTWIKHRVTMLAGIAGVAGRSGITRPNRQSFPQAAVLDCLGP